MTAAVQGVSAQGACQQLQLILQDICSLSNMLVPLSSSALWSALSDSEKKPPLLHSWSWGLDFETWDSCRVVCTPFASGWQSNMANVNYGAGSGNIPRELDFLCHPAPTLLLAFSLNFKVAPPRLHWARGFQGNWPVKRHLQHSYVHDSFSVDLHCLTRECVRINLTP